MEDNELHRWLIDAFGPLQGEAAWAQFKALPDQLREQLMRQDLSSLPKPAEVRSMMQAFSAGGLNTVDDIEHMGDAGPINVRLARSIADGIAGEGAQATVSAEQAQRARAAMSTASLWLDAVCAFDPPKGTPDVLTRTGWVDATLDSWTSFAAPVAKSMSEAMSSVLSERLGGALGGEVSGIFAGPVPIPLPDGLKDPAKMIALLGNTSFAMQLGRAAGNMSREVHGGFDQGLALLDNPAGALVPENIAAFAKELQIDETEVMEFLALREAAHARLFNAVPWLMPRLEALLGKYARGISIDMDAMEEQMREAQMTDPESLAGAVNVAKVGMSNTPEQAEALHGLETTLALLEGWVDCVVWRAGVAYLPHLGQLREMMRRERATGGPAERTFESLVGLQLRPKSLREAAQLWERITAERGADARDAMWAHPDLLPTLDVRPQETEVSKPVVSSFDRKMEDEIAKAANTDWDAELSKLLDGEEDGKDGDGGDGSPDSGQSDAGSPDSSGSSDDSGK